MLFNPWDENEIRKVALKIIFQHRTSTEIARSFMRINI